MRMVVGVIKAGLPRVLEALTPHNPAIRIQRRLGGHIHHTAAGGGITVILPLLCMIRPVGIIGVHIGVVDVIQLACLKEVRRGNVLEFAVKGEHIRTQPDNPCRTGHIVRAVGGLAGAEGQPAHAVFINHRTRIKGVRTVCQPRCGGGNQRSAQRILPGAQGIRGGNDANAGAVIGKIQIKMGQTVRFHPGNDGRRPGIHNPGGNLIHMDLSMIGPVDHILRRQHHQGLDGLIGIVHIRALGLILLVIVGTEQIQSAVVLHRRWVCTEKRRGNGIIVMDILELICADFAVADGTLLLCCADGSCGCQTGWGICAEACQNR